MRRETRCSYPVFHTPEPAVFNRILRVTLSGDIVCSLRADDLCPIKYDWLMGRRNITEKKAFLCRRLTWDDSSPLGLLRFVQLPDEVMT